MPVLGGLFGSLNQPESSRGARLHLRRVFILSIGVRGPGPFVVSTAVQSEVTTPALREILLEIERIRAAKIAEDELSLARDYLDGVFPIRYETTAAIASALATLVIYALPVRLLRRLTEPTSAE